MNNIFYYLALAIATTYCVHAANNKASKILFTISTICWWILAIGEFITKFV